MTFDELKTKIFKLVDHNRFIVIAIIIVIIILFWLCGCQPTVKSVIRPSTKVTRVELQAEVDSYLAIAQQRFRQLDQQEEFARLIFNNAFIIAQSGTLNPLGILTSLMSIVGVGAIADNRRKDKKIAKTKAELAEKSG